MGFGVALNPLDEFSPFHAPQYRTLLSACLAARDKEWWGFHPAFSWRAGAG
jgi:hypothetical protein